MSIFPCLPTLFYFVKTSLFTGSSFASLASQMLMCIGIPWGSCYNADSDFCRSGVQMRFCISNKLPVVTDAPDQTQSSGGQKETSNNHFPVANLSLAGIRLVWLLDKISTHLAALESETMWQKQPENCKEL